MHHRIAPRHEIAMSTPLPPAASERGPSNTPPPLRGARAAVVFLTRVPVGGFPYREADWRWAAAWFPVVGALVGAAAAAAFRLGIAAGPTVAGALAVVAALLVTGALHEDGLADTADALGGAGDRERLFAILKDSRIGVFGAAALTMALILRVALLARLDHGAGLALVLAGAWSRAAPVWLMAALPYVTPAQSARNRPLTSAGALQAAIAAGAAALITAAALAGGRLGWRAALVLPLVSAAVALAGGWRFHASAGGVTGDFLGATQQVCECALLLALALA
jgi:adenosylcobinamide-GDP ribazoletransferase